ncbi:MAG TPA: CBS domain-containing protein, partial [Nannocystis sp.]
ACELDEVLRLMRERGIRRVPVVDTAGALVGIITFDDIVDILAEQLSGLATLVKRQIRHEAQRRV